MSAEKSLHSLKLQRRLNMERSELEKQRRHFELQFANEPQMSNESQFHILIMKLLNLDEEEIRDGDD